MLKDLQAVLGACRVGKSRQLAQDLNYRRAGELPPLLLHPLGPDRQSQSAGILSLHRCDHTAQPCLDNTLSISFTCNAQTKTVQMLVLETQQSQHLLSRQQQLRVPCCSATQLWAALLTDFMQAIAYCWQLLPWSQLRWLMWE